MAGRTDCHSHVLPGIDDGSRDVEMSLAMLRESARQGVSRMMATPHFYAQEQSIDRFLHRRNRAWESLKPHLEDDMPQLRLGAEVHYFEGMVGVDQLDQLKLEGCDVLLLEMPFRRWSERETKDIFSLANRPGITVLMAHIERYLKTAPKGIWSELGNAGVLFQCNAEFFLDWRTGHKALKMLGRGEIALLGSDCHNMSSRAPNLGKAMELIGRKLGPEALERLNRRAELLIPESALT